jgi:hypothetical protein
MTAKASFNDALKRTFVLPYTYRYLIFFSAILAVFTFQRVLLFMALPESLQRCRLFCEQSLARSLQTTHEEDWASPWFLGRPGVCERAKGL